MPQLRDLQEEALNPLRERWVHGDPPGSGKTPMGLTWLRRHGARYSLVVCPSSVVSHWERLSHDWFPEAMPIPVHSGSSPKKRKDAQELLMCSTRAVFITTYALFRQDVDFTSNFNWDAVIFDEAHRLKNRATLLHKAAAKVAHRAKLVDLSTGSVSMGDADEIWSFLHLMDPRKNRSFWRWVDEKFVVENTTFHGRLARPIMRIVKPKDGAIEEIRDELAPWLVQRSEAVMLPHVAPPVENVYTVDLSPTERKAYDAMKKHSWTRFEESGEVVSAPLPIARDVRLRQMASDWGDLGGCGSGARIGAVVELIEDMQGKSVVAFTSFKSTASALKDALKKAGVASVTFTGDDDVEARDKAVSSFRSGWSQVLIGTYGALAEGVDGLQDVSHHVILVDMDWSPEIERQAIRRLVRDGQELQVIVHRFVVADTIDQDILQVQERKRVVAETVLGTGVQDAD